jgi:hypothetical protein
MARIVTLDTLSQRLVDDLVSIITKLVDEYASDDEYLSTFFTPAENVLLGEIFRKES